MKAKVHSSLAVLLALAGPLSFAVNPLAAGIAAAAAGIPAILLSDYGRDLRPLEADDRPVPFPAPGGDPGRLQEAA